MSRWRKVPSVWKGGKPYFWVKQTSTYVIWIVWDRGERLWRVEIEDKKSGKKVYSYFNTDKQGKEEIDIMLRTHKLAFIRDEEERHIRFIK